MIPGLQGRLEWMAPTIDALSRRHRVLSFSLGDSSGPDPFPGWLDIVGRLIDRAGEPRVTLVGVSYGGLIAVRYAARHAERVGALVLVATPSPLYSLDRVSAACAKYPRAALPLFALRGCLRVAPEIFAARDEWPSRMRLAFEYAGRAIRYPLSPTQMASWVGAWMRADIAGECGRVTTPTLLVTGEPALDRVVPVDSTLEYRTLLPDTRHQILPHTGHIGWVSKPDELSALVDRFLESLDSSPPPANRSGAPHSRHAS
ncbi:MAG TPA: alpha/beta hydrolase [Vicinamibacterales bacterium]|nr:alpha/beta hydrolase [Vicinamibacterales bacterium]